MSTLAADQIPTSLAQQYRLEHDLAHGDHPRQQPIVMAWRVHGRLDVERLRAALDQLPAVHPALRTTFARELGATAALRRAEPTRWPVTVLPAGAGLEAIAPALWDETWDFATGPLLRAFVSDEADPLLALVVEHLLFDMVAIEPLVDTLSAAYAAAGEGARLPGAHGDGPTYLTFAAREREAAGGERAARVCRFWDDHWGDSSAYPAAALAPDGPEPGTYQFPGRWHDLRLEGGAGRLSAAAAAVRATPFALGLTALARTERAITGGDRPGTMLPTANRAARGSQRVVGFFANPVCCYLDLGDDVEATRSVAAVQDTVLSALEHQDWTTQAVVQRMRPAENHLGNDVPHLFFDVRDPWSLPCPTLPGLMLEPLDAQPFPAWRLYPGFNVSVVLDHDDLVLRLHHAPQTYTVGTVDRYCRRLAAELEQLLEAVGPGAAASAV